MDFGQDESMTIKDIIPVWFEIHNIYISQIESFLSPYESWYFYRNTAPQSPFSGGRAADGGRETVSHQFILHIYLPTSADIE